MEEDELIVDVSWEAGKNVTLLQFRGWLVFLFATSKISTISKQMDTL